MRSTYIFFVTLIAGSHLATAAPTCSDDLCGLFPRLCRKDDSDKWAKCKSTPGFLSIGSWACGDNALDFPTVDCIVEDMKRCGNVGENTVFYSFGISTIQARENVRDKLEPKGTMFNDALDEGWWEKIRKKYPSVGQSPDNKKMVARYSQALAKASKGTAYIVVSNRDGIDGQGAYQKPKDTIEPNIWRTFEFPTLQRNSNVERVVSVAKNSNYEPKVDWTKGGNAEELPDINADEYEPQPPRDPERKLRQRENYCEMDENNADKLEFDGDLKSASAGRDPKTHAWIALCGLVLCFAQDIIG